MMKDAIFVEVPTSEGMVMMNISDISAFRCEKDGCTAVWTKGSDVAFYVDMEYADFIGLIKKVSRLKEGDHD